MEGNVKFFSEKKGFGFIEQDDSKDVFFHVTDIENNDELIQGDEVSYEVVDGQKGKKAIKVVKR